MATPAPRTDNEDARVIAGVLLALGLHALQLVIGLPLLAFVCGNPDETCFGLVFGSWLLVGVSQLLYNGPLALYLWRTGHRALLKGVIIGAALTLLLNAACWGLLFGLVNVG